MAGKPIWRRNLIRDVVFLLAFGFEAVVAYRDGDVFYTAAFFSLVALMVGTLIGEASAEYQIKKGL